MQGMRVCYKVTPDFFDNYFLTNSVIGNKTNFLVVALF